VSVAGAVLYSVVIVGVRAIGRLARQTIGSRRWMRRISAIAPETNARP
jgi:hypothetical protein